jgi:hypothetical protein
MLDFMAICLFRKLMLLCRRVFLELSNVYSSEEFKQKQNKLRGP